MNKPIIFIHFGDSWYLKNILICAKKFNPNTSIILLGDNENKNIALGLDIEFKYYEDYGSDNNFYNLKNNYIHIGSAPKWAHYKHHFNIMRWPRLYDFATKMQIKSCWYFDSDTLICRDLSKIENYYNRKYYVVNRIDGSTTLINDIEYLRLLCEIIYKYIKNEDFINYHKSMIIEKRKIGKLHNLCDMSFIEKLTDLKIRNEADDFSYPIILNNKFSIFDWKITVPFPDQLKDYPFRFEMENKKKKIIFIDKKPYLKRLQLDQINPLIRANTLNMSWIDSTFFNKVLSNLGLK